MMNDQLLKFYKDKHRSKISSTRGRKDKIGNDILMKLTLDEFIKLYEDAGVLPMSPYVLSRVNDIGHYEVGNVFVSTNNQNSLEAHGIFDADAAALTDYCLFFKYKRTTIKKSLESGKVTWEEIYALKPITRYA